MPPLYRFFNWGFHLGAPSLDPYPPRRGVRLFPASKGIFLLRRAVRLLEQLIIARQFPLVALPLSSRCFPFLLRTSFPAAGLLTNWRRRRSRSPLPPLLLLLDPVQSTLLSEAARLRLPVIAPVGDWDSSTVSHPIPANPYSAGWIPLLLRLFLPFRFGFRGSLMVECGPEKAVVVVRFHSSTNPPSLLFIFIMVRRFRSYARFREDLWGQLLLAPNLRLAPQLALLLRSRRRGRRFPKAALRELLPPPPAFRGRRRRPTSAYGRRLLAKQQLRWFYNLRRDGRFQRLMLNPDFSVERLPSVLLYRSRLAPSIVLASQWVSHGLVRSSSVPVRIGGGVRLTIPPVLPPRYTWGSRTPPPGYPPYLEVSHRLGLVLLLRLPRSKELFFPFETSQLFKWSNLV